MKKTIILFIIVIMIILFPLFYGCNMEFQAEVGIETFKYQCNTCGYTWTAGPLVMTCARCSSPSIEIIGEGDV